MKRVILIIILFLTMVFLYGRFIEVNNIKVKEYIISSEKVAESFNELKIVQFSDILYNKDTKYLNKIIDKINNEKADIVIFTGDLFNSEESYSDDDINTLKESLKKINTNLFKFAVIGDNDLSNLDTYKDILYDADFTLLDNKNKLIFYKDKMPINIIGLSDLSNIEELLNTDVECNYHIAITHKSDYFDELSKYNIDVVMSGNSLGGIVKIPYYGGLIKKEGSKKYLNDYYQKNSSELYVSNGLGNSKFAFRLLNNPSINVYRFK